MFRFSALFSALLLSLSVPTFAQGSGSAVPTLKASVVVDDGLVTLGDLITHAGDKSSIAVFRAPHLGNSGKVSASRVIEASRKHGVNVHGTDITSVTVTRNSRAVTEDEILQALTQSAKKTDIGRNADEIDIRFSQPLSTLHLPVNEIGQLGIHNLFIAPRGGRFTATVTIEDAKGNATPLLPIQGTLQAMVNVPVLATRVERGQPLTPSAFVFERRPHTQVPRDAAELEEAIGMAAARNMSAGTVLKRSELMEPVLVERNEIVTMILKVGRLRITARGRALGEGGKGATVAIMNMDSKRNIDATVISDGVVLVEGKDRPIQIAQNLALASQGN